jgi:hypothetical protein
MLPGVVRLAGWAGVVTLLLSLVVMTLTKNWSGTDPWRFWPSRNDSNAEYASWFADHSASFTIQLLVSSFGAIMAAFFVFGLVRALRLPLEFCLSIVMLGSALTLVVITIVVNGMYGAGLEPALNQDPAAWPAIRTATEQSVYTWYASLPVNACLLFAAATANHQARSLPAG